MAMTEMAMPLGSPKTFKSVVYAENIALGTIDIPVDGVVLIKFVITTDYPHVSGYAICVHIEQTDDVTNCIDIGNDSKGGIKEDDIICRYGYLPVLGLQGTKHFTIKNGYSATTPIIKRIELLKLI